MFSIDVLSGVVSDSNGNEVDYFEDLLEALAAYPGAEVRKWPEG